MAQCFAHLKVNDEIIMVLARPLSLKAQRQGLAVALKIRDKSKTLGCLLEDESKYLEQDSKILNKLKSGEVIKL
jgi:hypothetical protein